MLEAALAFAARGWPVFPCNMTNKQPLLAADKDPKSGAKIKGTGGVSKASCDPAVIRGWWKKWAMAMVGVATGYGRLFVVDFDPRKEEIVDEATGEVTFKEWTLERQKAELEAQIGCPLPVTLAVRTQSGGVHLYFLWPDDGGAEIRNRGNLPEHVDVRGKGGYVIAPPSVMEDGAQYRWLRGDASAEIVEAPAALIEVLRSPKVRETAATPARPRSATARPLPANMDDAAAEAVRKYALTALDGELRAVRQAGSGKRNEQLNISALKVASLVAAGALDEGLARYSLEAAARENPGRDSDGQLIATIDSGWSAGMNNPRDLGEVAAAARERASRSGRGGSYPSAPPPAERAPNPSDPSAAAPLGDDPQPFRNGRLEGSPPQGEGAGDAPPALNAAEKAQLTRIAEAWLERRLESVERTEKALKALAWGVGRRAAAELLDENAAKERIWPLCEGPGATMIVSHADIDRAVDGGFAKGFDPGPLLAELKCAHYPMTDFGIAERFRDRFGGDYRFTTAKGWLGWDQRRWKVLDQEKDVPPAEVIAAVFETVRAIQSEARRIKETGIKLILRKIGKNEELDLDDPDEHALDHWVLVGKQWKLFSGMLSAFGRVSETSGKPVAIANLARRWLTASIEDFDCDPFAINVLNGTLRFRRETLPDGTRKAVMRHERHRREDLNTKLAPVEYDPKAACPLYDGMIDWAQPDAAVRRYLHQWGGYSATGHTGEHKLHFWYGKGRNGKSTTIDMWCFVLGDYSGTIGIETFLDQGIKKRGEQASPDLARLGGVRMLRASEPERGAKLNEALIKAATGGEPMAVRALHRGFFDLLPRFKLTIGGNYRPDVPGTDEGIWARLKLVPWTKNIDLEFNEDGTPKKDPDLLDKMKAREVSGVFNRLVAGLMDWLANGLAEPSAVKEATQAYRDDSDPLARFLRLCTVTEMGARVQSSQLHAVFAAWCKAAGEKEWTNKGFSKAMGDKGFQKKQSDGMQWLDLKLIRQVSDFVDEYGNVRVVADDLAAEPPNEDATLLGRSAPPLGQQDDFIGGWDVP